MSSSRSKSVTRQINRSAALTVAVVLFTAPPISGQSAERVIQHRSGQTVAPVYDGYEVNPDGTFSMWFGYFNRNHAESIDVPIGANNHFEPQPADRGQPTHFVPQWQKSAFRVIVPKDWGDKKLIWHLTTQGSAQQVEATLDHRAMIDRQTTTLEGGPDGKNKAPTVAATPASQTVAVSGHAKFEVKATDDGFPANKISKKPEGLHVRWRLFRGPANGRASFSPARGTLTDGHASTTATFSVAGEYVIQAVVDDGSLLTGTYCCWVNSEVKVTVK